MFQHFDWDLTYQVLFLYILSSHRMNLRDQPWKILILWCRTGICNCKFSAKVSLMLGNPFLAPSLCKLNHTSLCFIQISTKSLANCLFPSGKAMVFLKSSLVFWDAQENFNITERFLLRPPMFPDYPFLVTIVLLNGHIAWQDKNFQHPDVISTPALFWIYFCSPSLRRIFSWYQKLFYRLCSWYHCCCCNKMVKISLFGFQTITWNHILISFISF